MSQSIEKLARKSKWPAVSLPSVWVRFYSKRCRLICFLLAVLINKRVSSVLVLNNSLLSVLVSLDLRRVHWSKRQAIIIGENRIVIVF